MDIPDTGSGPPEAEIELVIDPQIRSEIAGLSAIITSDWPSPPNPTFVVEESDKSLSKSSAEVPTSDDNHDNLKVIRIEETDESQAPPKTALQKVKNALREVLRSIKDGRLTGVKMFFKPLNDIKAQYPNLIANGISFFWFNENGILFKISWTDVSAFNKFKEVFLSEYGAQRVDTLNMFNQFGFTTYIVRNGEMVFDPKYNKPHARKENYTKRLRVSDCDGLIVHDDPDRIAEVKDGQIKSLERAKESRKRQRDPTGGLKLLAEVAREDAKQNLEAAAATYADAAAFNAQT